MSENDVKEMLIEKSQEFKKMLKDHGANLEQWKFSIEETKEGTRVEIHVNALLNKKKK
jgi:hypothetical protein